MKKTVSFFLIMCVVLSLSACSERKAESSRVQEVNNDLIRISGEDMFGKIEKNEGVTPVSKRGLNNTLYKVQQQKELTVAYFGGSVTLGVGASDPKNRWASITHRFLEEKFPSAKLTEHNCAVGGSGSEYGLFRAKNELLSAGPDLVFIEFAINDAYQGNNKGQSGYFTESLIRSIYEADKTTDIIMVFITDKGAKGAETDQLAAQKEIAEHYGIPYVMAGKHLADTIGENGVWEDYLTDWAHPSDLGYKVYGEAVTTELEGLISTSKAETEDYQMPEPIYKNLITKADVLTFTKDNCKEDGFVIRDYTDKNNPRSGHVMSVKEGGTLEIEFEGSVLGMYTGVFSKNACSEMEFIVDDRYSTTYSFVSSGDGNETVALFDNLNEGKHTLKMINKSGKKATIYHLFTGSRK